MASQYVKIIYKHTHNNLFRNHNLNVMEKYKNEKNYLKIINFNLMSQ